MDLSYKLLGAIRLELGIISETLMAGEHLELNDAKYHEYSEKLKTSLIECRKEVVMLVKKYGEPGQKYDRRQPLAFSGKQRVIANSLIFKLRDFICITVMEDYIPRGVLFGVMENEFKTLFDVEIKPMTYQEIEMFPLDAFTFHSGPSMDRHARDEQRPVSYGPNEDDVSYGPDEGLNASMSSFRVDKEMQNQLRILENFHLRLRHLELQS
jgi:hypothetical protein